MIGMNIINSSFKNNVKKLINLGSSCIYPKRSNNQSLKVHFYLQVWKKPMKVTLFPKIVTLKYCQYLKQKYKKKFYFNTTS